MIVKYQLLIPPIESNWKGLPSVPGRQSDILKTSFKLSSTSIPMSFLISTSFLLERLSLNFMVVEVKEFGDT